MKKKKNLFSYILSALLLVLLIAAVTLKLCGVITWSWWWVLSPLWGPFIFTLLVCGFVLLVCEILVRLSRAKRKRSRIPRN